MWIRALAFAVEVKPALAHVPRKAIVGKKHWSAIANVLRQHNLMPRKKNSGEHGKRHTEKNGQGHNH